ncbi:hypothetical protein KEJ18_04430 [Candidatus Bathyarchaeota archaeon]|nr:hypothetical protein [Candidatus Bathyarchaeota archaeon]
MQVKKKKKSIIDRLFRGSFFDEPSDFFDAFENGMGSGYSISVTQTSEGTKVRAKVSGDVDVGELRRKLQQQYPNAHLEIEGGKPLIREISTKPADEKEEQDRE